jgi:hypothetical protein
MFVLAVSGAGVAIAAEPGHVTLTVDATVITVMPETSAPAAGPLVPEPTAAAPVDPMVQVGGSLYPLPVPAPAGTRTGDHVVLTLEAAPGLSVHDARALRRASWASLRPLCRHLRPRQLPSCLLVLRRCSFSPCTGQRRMPPLRRA